MKMNLGVTDRLIRLLLSSILLYLGLVPFNNSTLGIGFLIVGGIAFLTGMVGFCGLYQLLGIHTDRPQKQF
ncbi:Inner membrane protein YgaP-like transmembrane domain-containing protein [Tumidithrix helvetica PCC 7403]|uniref:YgaP family membrane protein n=1 Tax=Tumidithrix helvetica TaxID=3457545 RepID=UPI003C959168